MSEQLGTCESCNSKIGRGAVLCPECGRPVPAPAEAALSKVCDTQESLCKAEAAKESPMDWKKIAQELYANLAVVLDQIDSCGPTEMIGAAFAGRELKASREILAKYRKEIYGNG